MASQKLFLLISTLLPIILVKIAYAVPLLLSEEHLALQDHNDAVSQATAADASFELKLRRLKSKIYSLETSIDEKTGELKEKDGSVVQLEKVIEEKSNVLASLQSTVRSIKDEGNLGVKDRLREVKSLLMQVVNLRKEIEAQNKKKDDLQIRANAAEKKIKEMNLKLESLQRINIEQKSKIRKAQHALQLAEEAMLKAKLEASSMTKQLIEVQQAWFPYWLSAHLVHCQSFLITHWNEHGRHSLDLTIQETLKKKSEIEKWMRPHLETFNTKWLPAVKIHCITFVHDFQPLVQSLSTQAIDHYHVARGTIEPYIAKILEIMDPYFQEAKMIVKPYIDQVSKSAKPHVDKAIIVLKPYSRKIFRYHKKITEKVQSNLHKTLKSYELTEPLATEGLVWFMASVLMALPVIILSRLLIREEPKNHRHKTQTSHTHRRTKKRAQPDK